jgi:phage terminase large subunit
LGDDVRPAQRRDWPADDGPVPAVPKQREFIEFVHRKWLAREDWLAEKSRDMGVSWLCVAFAVWMFLFKPGTVVGFGSRKEEYVDRLGDPKSLFWKVRQFVELLPLEFRPKGWDMKACAPFMRIQNPENGSAIIGEAGDNIGRGNRTSIYFKDESAFYERPETIDAALSQTSNCKGDVSTPNGAGNPFYRKRKGGKVEVFTFNWRDDPRKGDSLVREAAARARSGGAGAGGRHQLRGVGHRCLHPRRPGRRRAAERPGGRRGARAKKWGLDVARFGDDKSVLTKRRAAWCPSRSRGRRSTRCSWPRGCGTWRRPRSRTRSRST